jgi:hypothetical protein
MFPTYYIATYSDVFTNIYNTHEALIYYTVNKIYNRLNTLYFGITRTDIK